VELSQLRCLLKIAEHQSITRAADELGMSQPALSRSLQRLEEELGRPLFERQTRQMVLTEAGSLFVSRARFALSILDDTQNEINDDGRSGRLRLGVIPTITPYFVPRVLQDFSKSFPQATVIVQEEVTHQLLQRLSQGELDLAIMALPIAAKYVEIEELFVEELLLVMPTGHPLAERKAIRLQDTQAYPFVMLDEAHCLSDNILSICRQRSVQPVTIEKTSQLTTVLELVALNHGISLVPEMARITDNSPQRVYRSLSGDKPQRTIVVAWNPYRYESKLQKAFVDYLRRSKGSRGNAPTRSRARK
jgi:LysR family transcriptional regulator, hydrogen peroxide-inducible genes activator